MNEHLHIEQLPEGIAFEPHFTPKQLAKMWGLCPDVVRRAFENEPDVVRVGHPETLHRRKYVSLRIPASVAARVHRRLTKPVGRPV